MENPGEVLTKEEISERIWNNNYCDDKTIMVHIRKLRQVIEDNPGDPHYIRTVWGGGYRFVPD